MFGLQLLARLYFGEPVGGAPGTLPLHCFTYIFHCVYCFCVFRVFYEFFSCGWQGLFPSRHVLCKTIVDQGYLGIYGRVRKCFVELALVS